MQNAAEGKFWDHTMGGGKGRAGESREWGSYIVGFKGGELEHSSSLFFVTYWNCNLKIVATFNCFGGK